MSVGYSFTHCQSNFHPIFLRPLPSVYPRFAVYCKALADSSSKSKGFGSEDGKSKGSNHAKGSTRKASGGRRQRRVITVQEGSPAVKKIMKEIEKGNLNIDLEDAIKGKADFARVESWEGLGLDKQLGDLKMKSFSPSFTSLDQDIPLYEQLVQRLQLLEAKGDIAVVQAKRLPPFEKWLFGECHYLQFLIDQMAVHIALEDAISSVKQSRCDGQNEWIPFSGAAMAVSVFHKDLGLNRSEALKADIESLSSEVVFKHAKQSIEFPKPVTQAVAYAKYLQRLGKIASSEENGKEACLNLFSHIFSVHVTHLTTGMRIGAKAVDCLPCLLKKDAVGFFRDYPKCNACHGPESEPVYEITWTVPSFHPLSTILSCNHQIVKLHEVQLVFSCSQCDGCHGPKSKAVDATMCNIQNLHSLLAL